VIRTARWLPLSLAVHAVALGGGVWLGRELGETALFVDMTLLESETPPARTESSRAESLLRAAGRPPARRAAAPGSPTAPAPPAAPAPPVAPAPPAASLPPVAPAPPVAPEPAVAPAPAVSPTPPVATAPSVAPVPPPAENSAVAPAPPASSAPAFATPGETSAASDGPHRAANAEPSAGDRQTGSGGAAPSEARGGRIGDGPLALAIPGDAGAGVYGPYLSALRRRLQESLAYPAAARRQGLSGTVHLQIVLDVTGRVSEVLLVRSSSHAVLDDAALEAARHLRRVPFPPDVRPRPLQVLMPVVFELR
jgi:protein TonB